MVIKSLEEKYLIKNSEVTFKAPESKKSKEKSHNSSFFEKEAYKDILDESKLQVKLADLGNACWIVSILFYFFFLVVIFFG